MVYDGPHTWMPAEFAERALAWLQLRAMVKGIATLDRDFINKQFDSRLAEAQAAQKSGEGSAPERRISQPLSASGA